LMPALEFTRLHEINTRTRSSPSPALESRRSSAVDRRRSSRRPARSSWSTTAGSSRSAALKGAGRRAARPAKNPGGPCRA
jgi:hypothetical protein